MPDGKQFLKEMRGDAFEWVGGLIRPAGFIVLSAAIKRERR